MDIIENPAPAAPVDPLAVVSPLGVDGEALDAGVGEVVAAGEEGGARLTPAPTLTPSPAAAADDPMPGPSSYEYWLTGKYPRAPDTSETYKLSPDEKKSFYNLTMEAFNLPINPPTDSPLDVVGHDTDVVDYVLGGNKLGAWQTHFATAQSKEQDEDTDAIFYLEDSEKPDKNNLLSYERGAIGVAEKIALIKYPLPTGDDEAEHTDISRFRKQTQIYALIQEICNIIRTTALGVLERLGQFAKKNRYVIGGGGLLLAAAAAALKNPEAVKHFLEVKGEAISNLVGGRKRRRTKRKSRRRRHSRVSRTRYSSKRKSRKRSRRKSRKRTNRYCR